MRVDQMLHCQECIILNSYSLLDAHPRSLLYSAFFKSDEPQVALNLAKQGLTAVFTVSVVTEESLGVTKLSVIWSKFVLPPQLAETV